MKRLALIGFVLAAVVLLAGPPLHAQTCTTIKSGDLVYATGHYLAGQPITTGVNPYGYNYQAHLFNGTYFNSYAGSDGFPPYDGDDAAYLAANPTAVDHWAWPYRNEELSMKWNDAWLSNQDCDGDGKLDRNFGFPSYVGSGAWLTNHQKGVYAVDGKDRVWSYFTKIVAAPADATTVSDSWIAADGTTIGPEIWGEFAIIQEVVNDPASGLHGLFYVSPYSAGLGRFGPQ